MFLCFESPNFLAKPPVDRAAGAPVVGPWHTMRQEAAVNPRCLTSWCRCRFADVKIWRFDDDDDDGDDGDDDDDGFLASSYQQVGI